MERNYWFCRLDKTRKFEIHEEESMKWAMGSVPSLEVAAWEICFRGLSLQGKNLMKWMVGNSI